MKNIRTHQRNTAHRGRVSCVYSRSGFLLLEMLVYITVLLLISVAVVSTFISLKGVFAQARAHHALTQAAESALERMLFEVDRAVAVDVAGSVLNVSPGSLTIFTDEGTRMFYLEGSQLQVKEDGVVAGPLSPATVSVENLVFTHYQNTHTEGVRVTLTLQSDDSSALLTKTFTTMTVLRNSYE